MEIRLLGPLPRVEAEGADVPIGRPLHQSVLAALALDPDRVVPRVRLAQRVWGENPPANLRASLDPCVTRVRARLHDASRGMVGISAEGQGLRLTISPEAVDWHRMGALRSRAAVAARTGDHEEEFAALDAALRLWETDPLSGLGGTGFAGIRETMESAHRLIIAHWAEAALRIGRGDDAIVLLGVWAERYPGDEQIVRARMRALAVCGRPAEAVEICTRLRESQAEELGLDLAPETQRLYERILRGENVATPPRPDTRTGSSAPSMVAASSAALGPTQPQVAYWSAAVPADQHSAAPPRKPDPPELEPTELGRWSVVRDNLPHLSSDLTGQEEALADVMARARSRPHTTAIQVITGMAGIGKTTLAIRAAHRLRTEFDRCLYVDLRGHSPYQSPMSVMEALFTLLRLLGVPAEHIPPESEARASLWRDRLVGQRILLVLDDAVEEQVLPLLPGSPGSLVLATSRRSLAAVEGADRIRLDVPSAEEAAEMFSTITRRPLNGLGAEEAAGTRRLIKQCGRLPFALSLLAGQLRVRPQLTVTHLADRLARRHDRLRHLRMGDRGVAAAIETSVRTLSGPAQEVLIRLGVHPSVEFSVHVVAAAVGISVDAAEETLVEACDANLVSETVLGAFRMHDLVAEFLAQEAADRLSEGERRSTVLRMLDYYTQAVAAADRVVAPGRKRLPADPMHEIEVPEFAGPGHAQAWFSAHYPTVCAAIDQATAQGFALYAALIPLAGAGIFDIHGAWDEAERMYAESAGFWRARDHQPGVALALLESARARMRMNAHTQALEAARNALAVWEQAGDRHGMACARDQIGQVHVTQGRVDEAMGNYERALRDFEESADERGAAQVLVHIGVCNCLRGEFDAAERALGAALRTSRRLGDRQSVAATLGNMAGVDRACGRHRDAARLCKRSLALFRELGDRRNEAIALNNMGDVSLYLQRFAESLTYFREARVAFRALGDEGTALKSWCGLGEAQTGLGMLEEARVTLKAGLLSAQRVGEARWEAMFSAALGDTELADDRGEEAVHRYCEALDTAREAGLRPLEAETASKLGDALAQSGAPGEAARCWSEALEVAESIGLPLAEELRIKLQYMGRADEVGA